MAIARPEIGWSTVEFSRSELTGAIGDTVTVLPIVVALAALTPLSLPHVLLAFGLFQVVWGLWYDVPISVEPMKALSALVIAGALSYADFLVAGLVTGVALLALGAGGTLARAERFIGRPVVRGVQLAVALVLAETGVHLALGNPWLAAGGVGVALAAISLGRGKVGALCVLGLGVAITVYSAGLPTPRVLGVPQVALGSLSITNSVLEGTLAQLAMTVGNAAVATSLLASEYFDRDVSPDELSRSMGVMTLLSLPLGGVPMCHGSGGLAGKYAFGARTAGANVVLGVLYGLAALVAGGGFFSLFPMAMLGIVLALVALELGKAALRSESVGITVAVGICGVLTNVGVAFVCGVVGYWLIERVRENGAGAFSRETTDERT